MWQREHKKVYKMNWMDISQWESSYIYKYINNTPFTNYHISLAAHIIKKIRCILFDLITAFTAYKTTTICQRPNVHRSIFGGIAISCTLNAHKWANTAKKKTPSSLFIFEYASAHYPNASTKIVCRLALRLQAKNKRKNTHNSFAISIRMYFCMFLSVVPTFSCIL